MLTVFSTIALASWREILSMNPTRSPPFPRTQTSLASWLHVQLLRVFPASVGDPGLYLTSSAERHRLANLPASELVRPFDFGHRNRDWLGSIRAGYVDHMAGLVRRLLAALEARYLAEQSLSSAVAALEKAHKRITDLEAAIHLITADSSVARPTNTVPVHEAAAPGPMTSAFMWDFINRKFEEAYGHHQTQQILAGCEVSKDSDPAELMELYGVFQDKEKDTFGYFSDGPPPPPPAHVPTDKGTAFCYTHIMWCPVTEHGHVWV